MSDQTAAPNTSPAPRPVPSERADLSVSVTVRDAASTLGVSERTIRRAITRGDLVAVKEGRSLGIPAAALEDYRFRRSRHPSASRPALHLVQMVADVGGDQERARRRRDRTGPAAPMVRLPTPLTGFIGRAAEIAAVTALLLRDDVRLVTLTGVGGVGKTRLAIQVAEAVAAHGAGGVVFVPLASIQDPALAPAAIARALGLRESGTRSPMQRLTSFLQSRRLLLVLDNFEHLTPAGLDLVVLLTACPGLTVLVTSHVPLRVSGERTFAVQPLQLPRLPGRGGTGRLPPLAELDQVESIQLFVERARAGRADFGLTPEQAPAVASICARLDGLPLAIELAAARCSVLTPESLLARLEHRLPLLTGGPRDQPGRLRTMRDAISWSHGLLSSAEQRLFRRLAVFAGGFTIDAATAMSRGPEGERGEGAADDTAVFACFEVLAAQSLVVAAEPPAGEPRPTRAAEPRFTMLATIREFGLEQLTIAGDDAEARAAHAAYVLALVEAREPSSLDERATWLDRMEAERDNARQALARAIERREPEAALRLAAGLGPLWCGRGPYGEGRTWLEQALALPDGPPAGRRAALIALSRLLGLQGDFGLAAAVAAEAAGLARAAGDRPRTAQALLAIGFAMDREGRQERATGLYQEALSLFRELGDTMGEADTLDHLGTAAWVRGEVDEFAALAEASLSLRRQAGDKEGIIAALDRLSLAARRRDDLPRQAALVSELLGLSREVEDPFVIASTLWTAAAIAGERGQAVLSARMFGAEEALRQTTGFVLDPAYAEDYAAMAGQIRESLGAARFGSIWAAGRALAPAEALAEAMAAMDHLAASPPATAADMAAAWHTVYGLTPREREVLRLVVGGYSDKEIAATLFVARSTVSKHVSAILDKLGAESRTAAAAIAYRDGLP